MKGTKHAAALENLTAALSHSNSHARVRAAAARALAGTKDAAALKALTTALSDPEPKVRQAAARSLQRTEDAAALEALRTRVQQEPADEDTASK